MSIFDFLRPSAKPLALDLPSPTPHPVSPGKPERITGSIKKLLGSYGFVAGDDGIDYFLHWSNMAVGTDFRRLQQQQRVSFLPVLGKDGQGRPSWRAVSVLVLDVD